MDPLDYDQKNARNCRLNCIQLFLLKAISTTTLAPLIPNEVKPEEENPSEVAQKLLSTEVTEEDERKAKQCLNMQSCIIEEDEEEDEGDESSKKDV